MIDRDKIRSALMAAVAEAERDGLLVRTIPRIEIDVPIEGADGRVAARVTIPDQQPYTVAEGRSEELEERLAAAVADAVEDRI